MFKLNRKIFIFLIILFFIFIQYKIPQTYRPVKGLLGNLLNPFIYVVDKDLDAVKSTFDNYIFLVNVKKENKKLKKKVEILEFENLKLKEQLKELTRLKKLLNFKEAYEFDTVACNVIGRNVYGIVKYLVIDRGAKDGLKIDMPVISSKGLAGKIVEVFYTTSKVKVVLDRTLKVSVMNFRSRETGVASGTNSNYLEVDFYSKIGEVEVGDLFITSGLGMLYPKGIPVGKVISFDKKDYGLFRKVYLKPTVDFNKLENVLVIKSEKLQETSNN